MDEELLRRLWEVTIPGADLDGELDPGVTYRPATGEGEATQDAALPTLWVTDMGLELRGVHDSQAERESTRDDAGRESTRDDAGRASTRDDAGRASTRDDDALGDSELAPTLEGEGGPSAELEATQDPLSAATIYEPPPSAAPGDDASSGPSGEASRGPSTRADVGAAPDALVYELKEVIGRGGMGVVYRARQSSLQRDVAVKTMQAARAGRRWRDRFVAEAVVTGRLDHPNIVPVYDLGQTPGGEAMLAMKLVEGVAWKRLLRPKTEAERARAEALDLEDHLRILISVCNAVAFAHSRGLVHNDLKPDNVMLGDYGEVLVMDWGLAVDVRDEAEADAGVQHKSAIKAPCGTPSYMAPELAEGQGQAIGPWTDVYLLGAILCELISGRPPHRGKTFAEVVMKAVLSAPKAFAADVPQELQAICHKAMHREPGERYPDALALREAIEAYLEHRESVQVAARARDGLAACQRHAATGSAAAGDDEQGRDALYDAFAGAVAGFQQALMLWDGNQDARAGVQQARRAYAAEALRQGDLGLAAAQLARAEAGPERAALQARVEQVRARLEAEARRARHTRLGLVGALVAVFLAISVGFLLVRSERDQAERERRDAVAARARADWEAQQAELARDAAELAARHAQSRLARSLTAEGAAMVRGGRWRAARERFLQAREIQVALGEPTLPAELGLWSVQRASRPPLFEVALEAAPAGVACTSDGRLVAADVEGRLAVFDRSTGRRLLAREAGQPLTCLEASPVDPDLVVAGTPSGAVLLWDLRQPAPEVLTGHQAAVTRVRFGREGGRLLTASADGALLRWEVDPARRGLPYTALLGHTSALRGLDTFHFTPLRRRHTTPNHALAIDAGGRLNWFFVRPSDELPALRLGRIYGVSGPRNLEHELGVELDPRCLAITQDFPHRVAIGGGDHTVRVALYTDQGWTFQHLLRGHSAPVTAVAWSPDGRHVVSAGLDDRVIVWNGESGEQVLVTRDHEGGAAALAISRRGDRVVVASRDGRLRVWDLGLASGEPTGAAAGRELRPLPLTQPGTAAALSPDGSLAAVAAYGLPPRAYGGEQPPAEVPVTVWDAETGRSLATLHGHREPVRRLAFLRDGAELLSADAGGTVRLWSIDDAFQLPRRTLETGEQAAEAAVDPDQRHLALGGATGRVQLFDLQAEGATPAWTSPALGGRVTALAVGAGGRRVLAGTETGAYTLWGRDAAEPLAQRAAAGAALSAAALAPDGATYALGGAEGRVELWRLGATAPVLTQQAHTDRVTALAFSPDGALLASASTDGVWRLWWVREGRELRSFGEGDPGGSVQGLGFSGDGQRLITIGRGAAELWDFGRARRYEALEAAAAAARVTLQDDPRDPPALIALGDLYAFRGSLRTAVELYDEALQAGGRPDMLGLARAHWELGTFGQARVALGQAAEPGSVAGRARLTLWRQELTRLDRERGGQLGQERWFVRQVRFSPDSSLLASSGSFGTVDLWSVRTGLLRGRLRELPGDVFALAFSASGRRLLAVDENGRTMVWDTTTLARLADFECDGRRVTSAALFDDGRVVTCDARFGLQLWGPAGAPLEALASELTSIDVLALSADERWLVASSRDGLELWDLRRRARVRGWKTGERNDVESLAFTDDAAWVLTGGYDRKLRVWRMSDGVELDALEGCQGAIYGLDAAGGRVAAASGQQVRVWDLATRRELAVRTEEGLVFAAAVSPDGRWVAGGTRDGVLMLSRLD